MVLHQKDVQMTIHIEGSYLQIAVTQLKTHLNVKIDVDFVEL